MCKAGELGEDDGRNTKNEGKVYPEGGNKGVERRRRRGRLRFRRSIGVGSRGEELRG